MTIQDQLHQMYGSKEKFLAKFNPSFQNYAASNPDYSIIRTDVPTISMISQGYGYGSARSWLIVQLNDLNEFVGVKRRMSAEQIASTADILVGRFWFLKVTEFLLFFNRMKCGEYEEFYGEVDPQKIISSVHKFVLYRTSIISKHEDDQRKEKYRMYAEKAISFEEYQEIKKLESWIMWAGFMTPDTWNEF